MNDKIPERDWRQFRELHKKLLEKFCERTLDEVSRVVSSSGGSAHERYLRTYKLIHQRDKDLAYLFNDFRRSTAIVQLKLMRRKGLLSDTDLSLFTEETQQTIKTVISI